MKNEAKIKGLYVGGGVGLALFALFGLLPGSFLGGAMGLNMAKYLFNTPLGPELLPRILVGASMILGVCISCVVFVVGSSTVGWLVGRVIDAGIHGKEAHAAAQLTKGSHS